MSISAGRYDRATGQPAKVSRTLMCSNPDCHRIRSDSQSGRHPIAGWKYPGIRARPTGKRFIQNRLIVKRDIGEQLFHAIRNQDHAHAPRAILDSCDTQHGAPVQRIATDSKTRFRRVGDHCASPDQPRAGSNVNPVQLLLLNPRCPVSDPCSLPALTPGWRCGIPQEHRQPGHYQAPICVRQERRHF